MQYWYRNNKKIITEADILDEAYVASWAVVVDIKMNKNAEYDSTDASAPAELAGFGYMKPPVTRWDRSGVSGYTWED